MSLKSKWLERKGVNLLLLKSCLRWQFSLLLILFAFGGCAHTASMTAAQIRRSALIEQELNVLIRDLNISRSKNKRAARILIDLDDLAVPRLIKELDITKETADRHTVEHAARAIRVLRKINTSEAVEACRRILFEIDFPERLKGKNALLTEALSYVCDNFASAQRHHSETARDIYIKFVMEQSDKYLTRVYYRKHWAEGRYMDNVQVDIIYGVPLLVKTGDTRAKKVLVYLLRTLTADSYGRFAVSRVLEDGYTITTKPFDYREKGILNKL
ncbi:hypothetical protein ACFLS1_03460 [Verrucomicrobiota bacterium]